MNYRVERTLLALSIALLCALGLFSVARAQDSNAVATTITIEPLDPVVTGTPVAIRAQLHTATNQKQGAVGNETLDLSVDGVHQRRSKTDANGAISFSLPGNLPVGKHTIQIDYAGTQELLPSIAVTELVIAPAGRQPAQAAKTVASVLTIDLINPLSVGEDGTVAVRLSTPSDVNSGAVGNEVIQLFVDDKPVRRARTDADGKVSIHIPKDVELPAGKHTIRAEYPGTHALLRSSSSTELFIAPAVVEIQITPALAGVRFALDKREFVSDQQGVARIEVNRVGDYPLEILPIASTNADSQIEFSRWLDEVFTSYRQVTIPLKGPLHVGFNVYKRVSQRYLDLESKPVDAGRITSLTLKSSQGMAFKLTDNQPRWMLASSIARRTTGLEETKILYSVDSVLVDGSNVVNQSQQRFHAQANDEWPIQLLLYTAQFQSRDALFKFPLGSGIHIEHPDGRVEQVPFGPNAELSIRSLVRGIYRVKVSGAPGISPISPIALSRASKALLHAWEADGAGAIARRCISIDAPSRRAAARHPQAYRRQRESVRTQRRDEPPSRGCAAICAFAYTVGGRGGAPGFVERASPAGRRSDSPAVHGIAFGPGAPDRASASPHAGPTDAPETELDFGVCVFCSSGSGRRRAVHARGSKRTSCANACAGHGVRSDGAAIDHSCTG